MELKNRKILFIAPKYYNYHNEIVETMRKMGAEVMFFPEMPTDTSYRILKKLSKSLLQKRKDDHLLNIEKEISGQEFDTLFVIRGEILTIDFLQKIKKISKFKKSFLYQWDSLLQNNYKEIIREFDQVQTFDMIDAKELKIEYLPLFFGEKYREISKNLEEKEFDIIFFGAFHSDRLDVIKSIDLEAKRLNLRFYNHLYITKLAMFRLLISRKILFSDLKFLKNFKVDSSKIVDFYKKSKSVLDIEVDIQNGLTIRTFETLGSGLKLITTNKNIKNEVFYNEKSIFIIDRKKVVLEDDFFKSSANINDLEQFYIKNWLLKILQK
jgi:hypothetical protein